MVDTGAELLIGSGMQPHISDCIILTLYYNSLFKGVSAAEGSRFVRGRPIVVGFPFIGDEIGGSHISAINLILGLDRTKIEPKIIIHKPDSILERYLEKNGLDFIRSPQVVLPAPHIHNGVIGNMRDGTRFLRATTRLSRFLREHGIDVVHTNDGPMHATWALAARVSGARLLWHHRGDPGARGVNMLAPLLADHIVTVSKFAQPAKPLLSVAKRMTVLHSPFDHPSSIPDRETCRRAFVEELNLPPATRFVGYVGALIERKRPLRFVEAVHAFARKHPEFPIAGLLFGVPSVNWPDVDAAVRQRAENLGIAGKIHLMGYRSPVAPCMCGIDALLVPAVNEPFGRTLIEAMLLGTPVVATDHGGNPEAIDDGRTGYLVAPEKPEAFVEPLEKLLFDECEWQKISSQAQASARIAYGATVHVDGITRLYETLVRRRAGSA